MDKEIKFCPKCRGELESYGCSDRACLKCKRIFYITYAAMLEKENGEIISSRGRWDDRVY